jgi:ATP:ADP antiporter, AAA family
MSSLSQTEEFTGWRKMFWPIHNEELKKFLPMGFIMFCILFNYTVLRDTKDGLVVNAAGAGVIPFLKFYCVTPAAILFVIFYSKLTNILSRENVFYAVVTPFLVFFGAFAFFIYPNLELLHPSAESLAAMHKAAPGLSGFINIYGYWAYSLFYILAEIWGSAMIALMFWQFANRVTRMRESKRFYGLFVVIGNLALIFSGKAVKFCSGGLGEYFPDNTWQYSLYFMMAMVVIMGVLAMWTYRWMHTSVLNDPQYYDEAALDSKPKKKKKKPGLGESIKLLMSSPELGLIALLIMAYGVTINLLEVQWKEQLKIYHGGNEGAYTAFMGDFSFYTGIATIIFSLFIGSKVLRIMSWFKAAVITPIVILVGGSLFFCFILSSSTDSEMIRDMVSSVLKSFATNPVAAATFLGAFIVVMSKSIKYSLFDPTKEMAYIPLSEELKTKGKAAVDVIGGRAGKAGGAFVQSLLLSFMATSNVVLIAPTAFVVFAVVALLWVFAVKKLSYRVNEGLERKAREVAHVENGSTASASPA